MEGEGGGLLEGAPVAVQEESGRRRLRCLKNTGLEVEVAAQASGGGEKAATEAEEEGDRKSVLVTSVNALAMDMASWSSKTNGALNRLISLMIVKNVTS